MAMPKGTIDKAALLVLSLKEDSIPRCKDEFNVNSSETTSHKYWTSITLCLVTKHKTNKVKIQQTDEAFIGPHRPKLLLSSSPAIAQTNSAYRATHPDRSCCLNRLTNYSVCPFQRMVVCLRLVNSPLPRIRWSSKGIPKMLAACNSCRVSSRSVSLGSTLPEGWSSLN